MTLFVDILKVFVFTNNTHRVNFGGTHTCLCRPTMRACVCDFLKSDLCALVFAYCY